MDVYSCEITICSELQIGHFFQPTNSGIFLFLHENMCVKYSLASPAKLCIKV